MSREVQQKLFTEFSTSYIPTINTQGCGLGLCISSILVKELGARPIKVKSQIGKGSCFYFSIDIDQEIHVKSIIDIDASNEYDDSHLINMMKYDKIKSMPFCSILIVDDNEMNRLILGSILNQYKISFSEACNGKEAVSKVLNSNQNDKMFQVIIMDCSMPVLNGFEATREIVKLFNEGKLKRMPSIIGYTAYTLDEDRAACFESGMVDYLVKPSPPDKIISSIKRFLY